MKKLILFICIIFSFSSADAQDYVCSADNWTAHLAAEDNYWNSVTYGNGKFVAVSYNGTNRIMSSADAQNWTAHPTPENNQWYSVTYGNGKFVAVAGSGTNRVMSSTDGENWTAHPAAENNQWYSVTYGNGKFVAISYNGTNRVMSSTDGENWTAHPAAENNNWLSVTYGNGKFVAVATTGTNRVMSSTDGQNWTAHPAAEDNYWASVTYGNGKFVAVATTGTNLVMSSTDGQSWAAYPAAQANQWRSVTYGNNRFVAVATTGSNRVMTSTNGQTWTAYPAAQANNWYAVTYGNGKFVAISYNGTNRVMVSACEAALPVTSVSFTAKAEGNYAKLQWQTVSEQNNKGFEIWRKAERMEDRGQEGFVKIGDVAPSHISNLTSQIYSFTDKNPLNGNNYYKLVQIDNDGTATELGVRMVNSGLPTSDIRLFPNPTSGKTTVTFTPGKYHSASLLGVDGKILKTVALKSTQTEAILDLSVYAPGVYFVKLTGKGVTETRKVGKE